YKEGGPFQGPDDLIIDEYYASQTHKHAGDTIKLMNQQWRIEGVVEPGKLARNFAEKGKLQDLDASGHKVTAIDVKPGDPSRAETTAKEFQSLLPNYQISTMEAYTSIIAIDNIPGLKAFRYVIVGIGIVIGFFVVSLSMYMAVLQRTREIGILKSLGASNRFVAGIILTEAIILGVGGNIAGIVMSFGSWWLIGKLVPASIPMVIVPAWWP